MQAQKPVWQLVLCEFSHHICCLQSRASLGHSSLRPGLGVLQVALKDRSHIEKMCPVTVQGGQAGRPNLNKAISVFRISFPFKLGIRDTKHAGLGEWMSSNDAALKAPYGLVPVSGQPLRQGGCGQGRQYPGPGASAKGSLPTLAGHLS